MKLPSDIKYNYDHNKKFEYDRQVFENRRIKIESYLEKGLKIDKSNIEFHKLGRCREIDFNLFVIYVEIREDYDIEQIFVN